MFRFNSLIVTSPGGSVLSPELIKHLNKLRLKVKLVNFQISKIAGWVHYQSLSVSTEALNTFKSF